MERWSGMSVVQVPDTSAQSTYWSGNVADRLSATLQKHCKPVFANYGLNTEAVLLLARASKFETWLYIYIF